MSNTSYDEIELQYEDVERQLSDPEVISDQKKYKQLSQKYTGHKSFVEMYREYRTLVQQKIDAEELLADPEMAQMAKEELAELTPKISSLDDELQLLIPKDPDDHRNAIVEIRQEQVAMKQSLLKIC